MAGEHKGGGVVSKSVAESERIGKEKPLSKGRRVSSLNLPTIPNAIPWGGKQGRRKRRKKRCADPLAGYRKEIKRGAHRPSGKT